MSIEQPDQEAAVEVGHVFFDVGWRRAGVGADHAQLGGVGGRQFGGRRHRAAASGVSPERHGSARIQGCSRQAHGRAGGVENGLALGEAVPEGVHPRRTQALEVGHHDGEPARHHRVDEQLFVVEREVPPAGIVDALVEQPRRRALITLPIAAHPVADQRPRPAARPRVVRLEVGTGDSDRVAACIGTAVHDPGSGCGGPTQLAGRLQHHPRRLGADQITRLTRRQRIRRSVEIRVLRFVPAVSMCGADTEQG